MDESAFLRQLDGVFAYLTTTLSPELLEAARAHDPSAERSWLPHPCPRIQIAEEITKAFRLQSNDSPLRKGLAAFQLYYREDIADALAVAFLLRLQGKDPIPAFTADYCVPDNGILTWRCLDQLKADREHSPMSAQSWNRISPFVQPGDRLAHYQLPASTGLILVRGNRRVWQEESFHYLILGPSLRYETAKRKFDALGGTRAFLAGEFDWPPSDWENPITDAEESAYSQTHRFGFR